TDMGTARTGRSGYSATIAVRLSVKPSTPPSPSSARGNDAPLFPNPEPQVERGDQGARSADRSDASRWLRDRRVGEHGAGVVATLGGATLVPPAGRATSVTK